MNQLYELLPTRKMSAFLLGAAVVFALSWVLVDVVNVLPSPPVIIMGAWSIIIGFILAVMIPNEWWAKVNLHTEGE